MNLGDDSENNNARRNRVIAAVIAAAAALILLFVLTELGARRTYSSYEVVKTEEKKGNVSRYAITDGGILRYSADGAALLDRDFNAVWDLAYTMTNVKTDICGNEILLYDRQGTDIVICDENDKVSSFSTKLPIIIARISGEDTVAVLLDNGDTVEFVYYKKDGSEIARGRSGISDSGIASSLAVSKDGMNVCISYITVADGEIGSTLRFYNFSEEKKKDGNNLVHTEKISGSMIPEVEYLDNAVLAAFGDSGFAVFRNAEKVRAVDVDDEIISLFFDESHIGLVLPSDDSSHKYKMQLYSINGKERASAYFDNSYTYVKMSKGQILFNDSSSFSVYTTRGICRFSGSVTEGNVSDVLRTEGSRYLIATDQLVEEVRLK